MKRYEIDLNLSGQIEVDAIASMYTQTVLNNIIYGRAMLEDEEYISKNGLTEEDLNKVASQIADAEERYLELLDEMEGDTSIDENVARFIGFNSNDNGGVDTNPLLLVIKDLTVSSTEELLNFVNLEVKGEKGNYYVEI